LISRQHDLTLRPITGPDELDLFNSLPYVLNDEVGGDLAAGRRRPEWLWLALRGDRVAARAGWWSRAGDQHPLSMDIFDIDGGTDVGVQLLRTAPPAVQNVPRIRAATDVGNAPMAAAFALAGYVIFERQIDMTWR